MLNIFVHESLAIGSDLLRPLIFFSITERLGIRFHEKDTLTQKFTLY